MDKETRKKIHKSISMEKLIALQPFLEACGVKLDKLSFEDSVTIVRRLEHRLDMVLAEIEAVNSMQDSIICSGCSHTFCEC